MQKTIVFFFSFLFLVNSLTGKANALEVEKEVSAKLVNLESSPVDREREERITKLGNFLKTYNSPLVPFARLIVEKAEENEIDWRLVVAIAGVESTFGKATPTNSYNGWGWANGNYRFQSWEEAIIVVTQTLNRQYKQVWKATTPSEIGRYYAASPTWAQRVTYFMNKIGEKSEPTLSL